MTDQNTPPGAAGDPGPVEPPYPPLPPPPPRPNVVPPRSGGSLWLGVLIGVAAMVGQVGLVSFLGSASPLPVVSQSVQLLAGVLPFVVLVLGVVLSVLQQTRRTGAGILISLGVAILVVGGLCVAMIARYTIAG